MSTVLKGMQDRVIFEEPGAMALSAMIEYEVNRRNSEDEIQ